MHVIFTHPRDTSTYDADITPECTGQEALNGLIETKFIEPSAGTSAYSLKAASTGKAIPPSQGFGEAGIKDGDAIAVLLSESGARG